MAYVVKKNPAFLWPLAIATLDGTDEITIECKAEFRLLRESEWQKLFADGSKEGSDRLIAEGVVVSIVDGPVDEQGVPLTLAEFFDLPGAATNVVVTYVEARLEIIRKNSRRPPANS